MDLDVGQEGAVDDPQVSGWWIHLSHKHLLRTCRVTDTMLGPGDIAVNE